MAKKVFGTPKRNNLKKALKKEGPNQKCQGKLELGNLVKKGPSFANPSKEWEEFWNKRPQFANWPLRKKKGVP